MVALINNDNTYQMANSAYVAMFHASERELIGKNIGELSTTRQFHDSILPNLAIAREGNNSNFRTEVTFKEQTVILDVNCTPYIDSEADNATGVDKVVISIRDISQQQQLVQQNQRQQQLLMQQSKLAAMGEMIGAIAHQWRQPLTAIGLNIINIEEAFDDSALTSDYLHKNVASVEQNLEFMSKTIDDFRNFFRPNSDKTTFSVVQALVSAVTVMYAQLQNNNIKLLLTIDDGVKRDQYSDVNHAIADSDQFRVVGYPNEFAQVVVNLLANARDAILEQLQAESSPSLAVAQITITLIGSDKQIVIEIADSGPGVPEAIKDKIFEPYFTTKQEKMGTGIGLYMSKVIIEEKMRGALTAINRDGACFRISLPKEISVINTDTRSAN